MERKSAIIAIYCMHLKIGDLVLFHYQLDTSPGVILKICIQKRICTVFWTDYGVSIERMQDLKLITTEGTNGKYILE